MIDEREKADASAGLAEADILGPGGGLEARPRLRVTAVSGGGENITFRDIDAPSYREAIAAGCQAVTLAADELGGDIPAIVIDELIANLVHASFRDAAVTVKDEGRTLIVSDRGPGLEDFKTALRPGFSSATAHLRRFIRGTGLGLGLVMERVEADGGTVELQKNLGAAGLVVTITYPQTASGNKTGELVRLLEELSDRQKQIAILIFEKGHSGPSPLSRTLSVSISTIHRDLEHLEKVKVLKSAGQAGGRGARRLTSLGMMLVDLIFNRSS